MDSVALDNATIAYDQRINRYLYLASIVMAHTGIRLVLVHPLFLPMLPNAGVAHVRLWQFYSRGLLIVIQELFVGCTLILRVLAMYSFDRLVGFILVTTAIVSNFQLTKNQSAFIEDILIVVTLLALDPFGAFWSDAPSVGFFAPWISRVQLKCALNSVICVANLANILMFYFGDVLPKSFVQLTF
ncbi:hypothetical protein K438DRAFT_1790453 [Mycena galopus ATCC 62051]|nr:hypothetical protein K438DRAFT_1790453 [Mycena galopus ATCC 62051]